MNNKSLKQNKTKVKTIESKKQEKLPNKSSGKLINIKETQSVDVSDLESNFNYDEDNFKCESDFEFESDFDFGLDNNNDISENNAENDTDKKTNDIDIFFDNFSNFPNNDMNGFANKINIKQSNPQQGLDLTQILKIVEQIFTNPQTQQQIYEKTKSTNNNIIQIRKDGIVNKFEIQIKKQLVDIVKKSKQGRKKQKNDYVMLEMDKILKKNEENEENRENDKNKENEENEENVENEEQKMSIMKLNLVMETIETEDTFIGLNKEEFIKELVSIPSQKDFDYFCKELQYKKKLTYEESSRREKLFTIMYAIGNYCIEPNADIKKIVLLIIKFEVIRNDLINRIEKINQLHGSDNVLDCITTDMLFTGLACLLSNENMKIISKNIAYYFTKIIYS